MPAKRNYTALIPVVLIVINVVLFVPIGWIVSRTLSRISDLEDTQSEIRLKYLTEKQYQSDQETANQRINQLENRLYEIR